MNHMRDEKNFKIYIYFCKNFEIKNFYSINNDFRDR